MADRRYHDAILAMTTLEAAGYPTRLAGGCVRDRLMGKTPADYDLATTALPEQGMHLFRTEKRGVVPTGIDHGTFTLIMPSGPIEITTLRSDLSTDGRYAEVAFGQDFAKDAARRDFTINALFEDAQGRIYDYVGGRDDIKQQVLRFVGQPDIRIHEDFLRILRLFRFWAVLGFTPDETTLAAVAQAKAGLKRISQERITHEWSKMCRGPALYPALQGMQKTGVFDLILPELAHGTTLSASDLASWQNTSNPPVTVLAGLCLMQSILDDVKLHELAIRLRLSKQDGRCLAFFATGRRVLIYTPPQDIADCLLFIDSCESTAGKGSFEGLFAPVLATLPQLRPMIKILRDTAAKFGHRRITELPITGRDVVKSTGLSPDPEVGRLLSILRKRYYNGQWSVKEEGLALLLQELSV